MATADEIMKRVREADQERIERRARLAADVATANARVDQLRAELADAERARRDAVNAAERAMTVSELAGFLDVRTSTINDWKDAKTDKRRARKSRSGTGQHKDNAQPSTTDAQNAGEPASV